MSLPREEVMRMARECGLDLHRHGWIADESGYAGLERFAALVAAAEREACAEIVDNWEGVWHAGGVVEAIRARGNGARHEQD